jgi:hypothetical protein
MLKGYYLVNWSGPTNWNQVEQCFKSECEPLLQTYAKAKPRLYRIVVAEMVTDERKG